MRLKVTNYKIGQENCTLQILSNKQIDATYCTSGINKTLKCHVAKGKCWNYTDTKPHFQ